MNDNVVVLSQRGLFFYAYDMDAVVLHNSIGYKLIDKNDILSCGFPETALGKVVKIFREKEIIVYGEVQSNANH